MHKRSPQPKLTFRANSRTLPPKKRQNRKRRNWNGILRRVSLLVICAEVLVALFANPYLRVTHVKIEGLQTLSPDAVFAAAHVPDRQNIFRLALCEPFAKRLTRNPVIAHVSRSIELPDTLVLNVTERQPFATLATDEGYWILDKTGVPFRLQDAPQRGAPVIEAAIPGLQVVPGKAIHADWLQQSYQLVALLSDKNNLGATTVKVDQNANLCLNRGDKLQIRLGQSDSLPEKIEFVRRALAANGGEIERRAAYIDVSYPEQPVWMPRKPENSVARPNGANINGNKYTTNSAQ